MSSQDVDSEGNEYVYVDGQESYSGMDMGDSGMIMQVGGMGMGGGGIPFSVASFCWFCMSYFDQNKQVQAIDKSTKRTFVG